jgi:hypothetical protein
LLKEPGVQVLDVPIVRDRIVPHVDEAQEPARNLALVLVGAVQNATLHAIEYAETLRPSEVRAVSFGLDHAEAAELAEQWLVAQIPHPLEIEDSPFRDIATSLALYLKQFNPNGRDRVVTIIMPESVVGKARHQVLHNQTALIVKRRLLFEDGVVVASVPYHV